MKKSINKEGKLKVPIQLGIVVLTVILLGYVLFLFPLRITSLSNSSKIAKLQCQEAGTKLSLKVNASADVVRNYSYFIAHLVATELIPVENKREFMLSEMAERYKNEKSLSNLWCTFEPNALDGMDDHFINRMRSNEKGVFEPWFADGKFANSPTQDYESIYYTIPKETRKEALTDPYWDEVSGKKILMISFSIPIMLEDEFLGVLGTDYYINNLCELISNEKVIGNSKLITGKGIIVTDDNQNSIGSPVNFDHNLVLEKLSQKSIYDEFCSSEDGDLYRVYVPVYFGNINNPWIYIMEIPAKQIYAEVRKIVAALIIIVILFGVSIYFYKKTVEKNHELEELHDVKDRIFSVVAHDLRSPMASLVSVLKLSNENILDAETQAQLLKDISVRVQDVHGLLDNLLRWAKTQMKGIVMSPIYFDVKNEIGAIMESLNNIATTKMVELKNLASNQEVFADRDMFSVVVRNLAMNALKYTSAGGEVTINSKHSENMLVVSVQDTGTGMSKEIQEHLFKLTETKSQRGTNDEIGTGLGLVLCSEFAKANGGNIWFNSKQGEGSTFYFSVPKKQKK